MKRAAILALILAGCDSRGTFVVLDFPSGPSGAASISASLTLDGQSARASFHPASGSFTFPTSASLEIEKGAGALTVSVTANDASGKMLASATGQVSVVRGETVEISLPLGGTPPVDLGGVDGAVPGLGIAPSSHDFGAAVVGSTSPAFTFTVTNGSGTAIGPLAITLGGADLADFAAASPATCLGQMLAAGASCTASVTFSPQSAGASKSATLSVGDGTTSASATLSGRAALAGALGFTQTTYTFAAMMVGTSGGDTTFTLQNNGGTPTGTVTISLSGSDADSFQIVAGMDACTGQSITAGGQCTVVVREAPMTQGPFTATLDADASPGGLATVDLNGAGQVAGMLALMNATPSTMPYDLGTVDVGTTGALEQLVTVTNTGDTALGALSLAGTPDLSQISLTADTTCVFGGANATVLGGGESCVLGLALAPTSFGTKDVQVTVSASPGGSASTYVTGVGHDQVTIAVANTSSDGSTGVVSDSPDDFDCGATCTHTFDRTTTAAVVTFTATPATGAQFVSWAMDPVASCANGAANATCQLTLDATVPGNALATPYTYTASYAYNVYTVTYARTDIDYGPGWSGTGLGTLTSDHGLDCTAAPCTTTDQVPYGTTITVTATPISVPGQGTALVQFAATNECGPGSTIASSTGPATCKVDVGTNRTIEVSFSAHNYAFLSDTVLTSGNLQGTAADGLTGADQICQADAAAANLPGTFHAWLSTSTVDAISRLGSANGWVTSLGQPLFHAQSDFAGAGLLYYFDVTAGFAGGVATVFTGTAQDGTKLVSDAGPCDDWTSATPVSTSSITWGSDSSGTAGWTHRGSLPPSACSGTSFSIYCFGTDIDYAMVNPLPIPTGARLGFLSQGTFTPATGDSIASLDTICQTEGASFTGHTFLAFATDGTLPATDRFSGSGSNWARPDGVFLTFTPDHLLTVSFATLSAWDVFANGSYATAGDLDVWTGAVSPASAPEGACGAWAAPAANGIIGSVLDEATLFDASTTEPCADAHHVLCLEP